MVFLPFLPKKIPFFFLLIFLSLIFSSGSLYSQVKIKEKVIIKPEATKTILKNNYSAQADHIVRIVYSGGGTFRVLAADYDVYIQDEATFDVEGLYQWGVSWAVDGVASCHHDAEIKVFLDESLINSILIVDACYAFGEFYILFPPPPPPPLPPFDFSITFYRHLVYGTRSSSLDFWYNQESEPPDKSVVLSFASADPDVVFVDQMLEEELSGPIIASLDDYYRYSVKCKSFNSVYPKKVKVIGISNGLERSDTLTILQPEYVRAYFEKESLSTGDTVNIIVKKVDARYGWESDYPDTTHFEVGIKEGCGLGMIMEASGTKRDHFSSIQQPIRFVVADSISVDADSVVLRVGAPLVGESDVVASSIIPLGEVQQKNKKIMNQNMSTQLIVNKKEILKTLDENSCTVYSPIYANNTEAAATISEGCDSAPKCDNETPKAPTFNFAPKDVGGIYCNQTEKLSDGRVVPKIGGTYFNNQKILGATDPFANFEINVCYNNTAGLWLIKTNLSNKITVQYEKYVCTQNIADRWSQAINSISEINAIPANKVCKVFKDLYCQYFLSETGVDNEGVEYAISELISKHEDRHENDLKTVIQNVYRDFSFSKRFLDYKKSCTDINKIDSIKIDAKKYVDKLLTMFRREEKENELREWGTMDEFGNMDSPRIKYEKETQSKVFKQYGKEYVISLMERKLTKDDEKCVEPYKTFFKNELKLR